MFEEIKLRDWVRLPVHYSDLPYIKHYPGSCVNYSWTDRRHLFTRIALDLGLDNAWRSRWPERNPPEPLLGFSVMTVIWGGIAMWCGRHWLQRVSSGISKGDWLVAEFQPHHNGPTTMPNVSSSETTLSRSDVAPPEKIQQYNYILSNLTSKN